MLEEALSFSSLRSPTLTVLAGGAPLPNVMAVDVLDNAHFAAARFRVRLALSPVAVSDLIQPGTLLDIQIGLGGTPTSIIQGEADSISMDVLNGDAHLEGRDLTARLVDSRTQETFSNQTASEIATTLAGRHGLTPNVSTTTMLAGRYYSNEHDRITLGQFSRATTEWDLLTFLAAREGYDCFVSGTTLNFMPASTTASVYTLTPGQCMSLQLERALTLARDVEVTVKSWNTRQQAAFTQTARGHGQQDNGGPPQRIVVVRPNLSSNDALQLAQRILADLSAHERVVSAELPGELSLSARSLVLVNGTGTDFDQAYYVSELDRHFSVQQGFIDRIRLKSNSPSNASTPPADTASP